ncbi:MAG: pyridoxamine 5'-phosphate oxidase family protein [Saprospiraceae bacterium]
MKSNAPSKRAQLTRKTKRGFYDAETINGILDESCICYLSFTIDQMPFILPTAYGRLADTLYFHGALKGRMMKALEKSPQVCINVSIMDGLVLTRAVFSHSMNYRSVVIFGAAKLVTEPEEKMAALKAITNQILPGRWDEARSPNAEELQATCVFAVSLQEAAAKVRTEGPNDKQADYDLPHWAGVVPLTQKVGTPVPDEKRKKEVSLPKSVVDFVAKD